MFLFTRGLSITRAVAKIGYITAGVGGSGDARHTNRGTAVDLSDHLPGIECD